VWARSIDLGPVVDAYNQAMKPRIANQGAKFWAAFQGLTGLDAEALAAAVASR
jgi:hypothetical protein